MVDGREAMGGSGRWGSRRTAALAYRVTYALLFPGRHAFEEPSFITGTCDEFSGPCSIGLVSPPVDAVYTSSSQAIGHS